jgi:glycyl-tRNA synthetase
MPQVTMEKITRLAKARGFVFPGSAIYGGLANSWDYGPLGTLLKNNIRDWWWERFVLQRADMLGMDAAILMNPRVWEASGHLAGFHDVLVDCKVCRSRYRADHLIEDAFPEMRVEGKSPQDLTDFMKQHRPPCPKCGEGGHWTEARVFNLLFETSIGSLDSKDARSAVYLRGELAQAMFVNFSYVLQTSRKRLPFGIASVGKVFRNEITPGNFTYRTLEFDLMELEYFVREEEWEHWFSYWIEEQGRWLSEMGFRQDHLRRREHTKDELSHYSAKTADIEYRAPLGWKELFGCAYRTDFDLKNHASQSGTDLLYTDPATGDKFYPHVIEPTFGLTRLMLMVMLEAYAEEEVPNAEGSPETRVVMRFHPRLAPFKAAVLPLSKKPELTQPAGELYRELLQHLPCDYDETQSIGRRYRRQDEIGTPCCVTVDFQSAKDRTVTVRDRDTMKQERMGTPEVLGYVKRICSPASA